MNHLAIIIPDKIPSKASSGVKRFFTGLQQLPDDYLIYHESQINHENPDCIIISPNLGILVVEIRTWYPDHIKTVSKSGIFIEHKNEHEEMNPLVHARKYLDSLIQRSQYHPLCSSVIRKNDGGREFGFPSGILLILPNCTSSQLESHKTGDLRSFFVSEHTMCKEQLREYENWNMVDTILYFRSCMYSHGQHVPLTCDQVHALRAIIHPEIIVELPQRGNIDEKYGTRSSLKILDCVQEKKLYQLSHGHHVFYGPLGSGKTSILIARAKILHNRNQDHQELILCHSSDSRDRIQQAVFNYPRISVYTFEQWAEKSGVVRNHTENSDESDLDFGIRFYDHIMSGNSTAIPYDEVFIDEANYFPPSWYQCARMALKNPDKGDLLIVIHGQKDIAGPEGKKWDDIGIHVRGRITYQGLIIEKQYRNTREILNLARLFLLPEVEDDEEQYKHLVLACDCSIRSGLKPLLIWNTSHDHQAEYVVYLVQRLLGSLKSVQNLHGIKPDDIAILYPYAEGNDINIINAMIANLGKFCPVHWVSEDLSTYDRINLPGMKVHDCHSINGYYYRVVMILFAENFERFFNDSEFFSDRNLFYYALTRPLDYLIIQYTDRTDIINKILVSGYVDEFIGK